MHLIIHYSVELKHQDTKAQRHGEIDLRHETSDMKFELCLTPHI
jgi:hypothetical protein